VYNVQYLETKSILCLFVLCLYLPAFKLESSSSQQAVKSPMGAGQSKTDSDEQVFYSDTPIQFSQDVVNHLADTVASPETSSERQSTLDAHVRSRIQAELSRLRQEEEEVKDEIERTLEKENLDRERDMAGEESYSDEVEGEESKVGTVKSSAALKGDLEEVRRKVERFQMRRELGDYPELKEKGEALLSCYKSNPTAPLDCWREVGEFKASVVQVEQKYVETLR